MRHSTVIINYCGLEPVQIELGDLEGIRAAAARTQLHIESFDTNCEDFLEVLEALSPFAEHFSWGDETVIDGVQVEVAFHVNGGNWFVPNQYESCVNWIADGKASWETIGPCIFDQGESLLSLGNLYWVDTHGDMDQQRVVVGRFDDEEQARAALAEASIYFSYRPETGLVCELDNWGEVEL